MFDGKDKFQHSRHSFQKEPKLTKTFLSKLKMSIKEDANQFMLKLVKSHGSLRVISEKSLHEELLRICIYCRNKWTKSYLVIQTKMSSACTFIIVVHKLYPIEEN